MKTLIRPCPACGNGTGTRKHTVRVAVPDELHFDADFDVVACLRCGCAFADIANRQSELDAGYQDHSKYADTSLYADADVPLDVPDAPWDVNRLTGVAAFLAEIVERRDLRVLDAGCATGTFLGALKARGFTSLWGLEPSPLATATARRLHGVEAVTGSFVTPPPGLGQFDVVTLQHVLEHLTDVRGAVRSLFALLKPGGLAYIETPDAVHYVDHLVAPYHDFNTEHINHFSLPLLRAILEDAGFESVSTAEKSIMCAKRYSYPAMYGIWRRPAHAAARPTAWRHDDRLAAAIEAYVAASARALGRIDASLRAALCDDRDVVVWGAGQLSMKLLRDSVLAEKHVVAIVDGSPQKHGLHMNGSVVVGPDAARMLDAPIVVTSIHHEEAIVAAIRRELGPQRRIVTLPQPQTVSA